MGPVIDQEAFDRLMLAQERLINDPAVTILEVGPRMVGGYFVPVMMVLVMILIIGSCRKSSLVPLWRSSMRRL